MTYICIMKLTLKIKLLPADSQKELLMATLKEVNKACNVISEVAFTKKLFNQMKLHHQTYYLIKGSTQLTAQLVIRSISKVVDAYKLDRKVKRVFRPLGSIAYDDRVLTYKSEDKVSVWCIGGRQVMPYICHNKKYIPYIKGEADLVFNKGKWYLFQTVDLPDEEIKDVEDFIGVDFGQTDIAVTSDGDNFNSEQLKNVRKKYSKIRASVQSKGTKGAKKLLKRLSGRESRFVSINNHTIAKQIVAKAKEQNKGIAIEDLTKIRFTAKTKSKNQKTELNRWSFYQLRQFMTYKAKLSGVKLLAIPPAYTSQTCCMCNHIGTEVSFRKGKKFACTYCGYKADADVNAARNIAAWGRAVNRPEKSDMFCILHHHIKV